MAAGKAHRLVVLHAAVPRFVCGGCGDKTKTSAVPKTAEVECLRLHVDACADIFAGQRAPNVAAHQAVDDEHLAHTPRRLQAL